MCKRLLDRNAIVTGAARGMGFAIARALFNEGARVAILDIDDAVAESAKQLDSKHYRVLGKRVDVTKRSEVENLMNEKFGGRRNISH